MVICFLTGGQILVTENIQKEIGTGNFIFSRFLTKVVWFAPSWRACYHYFNSLPKRKFQSYSLREGDNTLVATLDDPQRPQYHFLPPTNWLNDPNGVIQWQGVYHLFYQYYPEPLPRDAKLWGHAISRDLAHWEHLPVALAPTPGTADEDGCWSGCTVIDNGVPTFVYSGNFKGHQTPCIARGSADLVTWEKYPGNPVMAGPPPGINSREFRDHAVWKEGDTWFMVIGARKDEGKVGQVLLFRSADLLSWEYLHPIFTTNENPALPYTASSMCECPDFFALDGKHVLGISVWAPDGGVYSSYVTGEFTNHQFSPLYSNKIDFGESYYAPQSFRDEQGRRIIWGWLRERRSEAAQQAAGWSGVMSLPWVLNLRDDNSLRVTPAPELQILRDTHFSLPASDLAGSQDLEVTGDALEILVEFAPGEAAEVGLEVRCSPDGSEKTRISYSRATGLLTVDGSQASLSEEAHRDISSAPLNLSSDETLKLHIFVDHSIIEVFANERTPITSRVYPTRPDSLGVKLFAEGSGTKLLSLEAWTMKNIWDGDK